jgi:uncharacterized protein (TIGR03085 family)
MLPLDARERDELCDLFDEVGPDAPTLCKGWSTLDLAAHLVVRERDPRSALAILGGGRFDDLEARLMAKAKARGLAELVAMLRGGPPFGPMRVPGLRTLLNLNEYFVHHEDVRRPNGRAPRTDRADLDEALWRFTRRGAWFQLRSVKARVTLDAPGWGTITHGSGAAVTLTGLPQELVLYLNGRRDAALVTFEGEPAAIAALARAKLGV